VIVLRIIINMEADDETIPGISVCRLLPDISLYQPDERRCASTACLHATRLSLLRSGQPSRREVTIRFDVGANGKVEKMWILTSEPQHLFDDAVISAAANGALRAISPIRE
jgi:TonB family protein